ncbi:unnamed protein product [Meganyctiphanes norvegica]|uniref:Serologically defined colon cancer antigen 1 n=1 Tax=Meganyctiphanes norvegica TaxID=48144 RepID=A0AAV2R3S4_MEGNR
MKNTYTTVDIMAIVSELKKIQGMRVVQVYDIDHKTYLIKLQAPPDKKCVLLLESAARIHTTEFDWPKSPAPSGFSMKLRKHIRNKRLEWVHQMGVDRIVDLKFGQAEAEHHLIVELYDRGNIVLTNSSYTILNILRTRKDGEETRFAVGEQYPVDKVRQAKPSPSLEQLKTALSSAKDNTPLKKILNPMLDCGGGVVEHQLLVAGFPVGAKLGRDLKLDGDLTSLHNAITAAQATVTDVNSNVQPQGYIIKKVEERHRADGTVEPIAIYQDFHPFLYSQYTDLPHDAFPSFNQACDEFYSKVEASKIDKIAVQKEREALKKLENIKRDHEKRIEELNRKQEENVMKGQLIELNQQLVEGALLVVRSYVANQVDWREIKELVCEAAARGHPAAEAIKDLKLNSNTITLWLADPYDCDEDDLLLDSDEEREEGNESGKTRPMSIDIDLDLSALANARKYYDEKRHAALKEQKTIAASSKALKSAEKQTRQTLKEVAAITNINKARKIHWFEKYLWFITSENFLVIAGRDSQTNEQVVKRHLKPRDVYVHADLHGAASVIVKNHTDKDVPPTSLHEAGIMATCNSKAWDEKVVTSAWWVWGDQVSKTAPSGEYLTTGSFMIRGKKNFLPPSHLVYGFGFLFRLEEGSVERHLGERKVRSTEENDKLRQDIQELSLEDIQEDDDEIKLEDNENEDDNTKENIKESIKVDADEDGNEEIKSENESTENQKNIISSVKQEVTGEKKNQSEKIEEVEFPDTVVEMSHISGDQFALRPRTVSSNSQGETDNIKVADDEYVVYLGDNQPVVVKKRKNIKIPDEKNTRSKPNEQNYQQQGRSNVDKGDDGGNKVGQAKRGQRGKAKKIKDKYGDQDEEERELRMQLLQSAGTGKADKKSKGKKGKGTTVQHGHQQNKGKSAEQKPQNKIKDASDTNPTDTDIQSKQSENEKKIVDDEEEEEDDSQQLADDINIINSLTAIPTSEDEILYAVPVCAPYTTMTNYRYKVKLTPGPGKKGKATKQAVSHFMSDKESSTRDKDLLRAVRDTDLSRNLPGKVKVSAPNMSKTKAKSKKK